MSKETEIRAVIGDPLRVQNKAKELGFVEERSVLQTDIMLDKPDGSLFRSGQKIRIRMEGDSAELTYKGAFEEGSAISKRTEFTVRFDSNDVSGMVSVFESLGYPTLFTIIKRRTQYRGSGVKLTFDEWPIIGCLVELEGHEETIVRTARELEPNVIFGNFRLKKLFQEKEEATGRSLRELQVDYEKQHNVKLGRLDFLLN